MFIVNEKQQFIDRVAPFVWHDTEHEGSATTLYLLGWLLAYLPNVRRSYYAWALTITYRPGQALSVYQLCPPCLCLTFFSRWELGLILGHWLLGLRLKQPLMWVRRLQTA